MDIDPKKLQKIAVIGCPGAGKTTFSLRLFSILRLPLYHLDKYYWKPGWQKVDFDLFQAKHQSLYQKESWIIEGLSTRTMHERFTHADTIIFLDKPRWLCLFRVIKRRFFWRNNKISIPQGCKERLAAHFLHFIWRFPQDRRPLILEKIEHFSKNPRKQVLVLSSKHHISQFFKVLAAAT